MSLSALGKPNREMPMLLSERTCSGSVRDAGFSRHSHPSPKQIKF